MDGLRLAVGTLTALPVRPPKHVEARTARNAALLAPLATAPLGLAVTATLWLSAWLEFAPLAAGFIAVGVLVLGSRAFHVDGLADTADGLTASYDRDRSLAVMKTGSIGPAGAAAVSLVLALQAIGFSDLAHTGLRGPLFAGLLVCLSRSILAVACMRGIPAAPGDGLRTPFAGSVAPLAALGAWAGACLVGVGVFAWLDAGWLPALTGFVLATLAVVLLLIRAERRFGGVTGDIFGASIEVTLAALLIAV